MRFLRLLAKMIIYIAIACLLVWFTLGLFYPEIKAKIGGLPVHKIIQNIPIITAAAFNVFRGLVLSLCSMGAAMVHFLRALPWPDIMIKVNYRIRWLMKWLSVFKEIVNQASGSTLGQFTILAVAVFIFCSLLALAHTVRILGSVVFYAVLLTWKTVTFILCLPWNIVVFIVDLF